MIPGVKARNLNCNLISAEKATDEFHQNKQKNNIDFIKILF